ncbi:MAG: cell division protein Fic [Nitrospira sp.]
MANGSQPAGATPGDDTSGLILTHLVTREERNAAEADEISLAYNKYIFEARRKKRGTHWLTEDFLRKLHQDMFGSLWEWAGKFRTDELNIGIASHLIPEHIRMLCDDFLFWDSPSSTMPTLEVAARLQNRLTKIHPFRNGNGRHARLVTDIFFYSRKHSLPEWPQIHLMTQGHEVREEYIKAMKQADQGSFDGLIKFIEGCTPKPA